MTNSIGHYRLTIPCLRKKKIHGRIDHILFIFYGSGKLQQGERTTTDRDCPLELPSHPLKLFMGGMFRLRELF